METRLNAKKNAKNAKLNAYFVIIRVYRTFAY